jgi:hypothetical protein
VWHHTGGVCRVGSGIVLRSVRRIENHAHGMGTRMTPERLAGLRRLTGHCAYHDDGNDVVACTCAEPLNAKPLIAELLGYVDELTRQLAAKGEPE